ncbi:MAG: hypothetical protein IK093_11400, partial [Ruminiclostridium sp.]|nr:hypothetical protein [Ruminiclostridium sp.]
SAEAAKEFMPERPEAYYEELRILFEKGDYESCLDRYKVNERILGTAGTELTGNIRLILANCCFESGDYEQAVKYYQSSLEYNSSLTECYRDMAISLARLGDIEGASDALVLAESAGVSNDQLLLIRAEVESAKNNYAEALTLFENTAESTDDEYILFRALAQFSGICADHGSEIPGSYRRAAALLEKYGSSVSTSYSDYVTEMLANQYTYIGDEENDDEYLRRAVNEYKKLMDEQTMKYVVCRNCFELQNRLKDYNDCLNTLGSMYHSFGSDYWIMKSYAYTLIYLQDTVDVSERDYTAAYQYYLSAKELYEEKKKNGKTDPSMDILDEHIEQIREKGWKLGKE